MAHTNGWSFRCNRAPGVPGACARSAKLGPSRLKLAASETSMRTRIPRQGVDTGGVASPPVCGSLSLSTPGCYCLLAPKQPQQLDALPCGCGHFCLGAAQVHCLIGLARAFTLHLHSRCSERLATITNFMKLGVAQPASFRAPECACACVAAERYPAFRKRLTRQGLLGLIS